MIPEVIEQHVSHHIAHKYAEDYFCCFTLQAEGEMTEDGMKTPPKSPTSVTFTGASSVSAGTHFTVVVFAVLVYVTSVLIHLSISG